MYATFQIKLTFETREYESSHGARPRGRGSWAFATRPCPLADECWFSPGALTLTEAKVALRRALAAGLWAEQLTGRGRVTMWVQP